MSIPTRRVSNPLMIGIFVLVGIGVLVALILWLGASRFFQEYNEYNTYFDTSVQGLEAGQPVKYQGVPVGNIQRLGLADDGKLIEVRVRINKTVAISDSMRLRIEMASIAGSRYLLLFYPTEPALLAQHPLLSFTPDRPVIPSAPSAIEELRVSLNEAINTILAIDTRGISKESVRALRAIAHVMENPEIAEIIRYVNVSSKGVSRLVSELDTSKIVRRAGDVVSDAQETSKNLVAMSTSLLRIAEQLEKTTARLNKEIDQLQIARQVEKIITRYDTTMLSIQNSVTGLMRRTDNSVSDVAVLLQDLRTTNRDLRKTLRMISDHPSQLLFAEPAPREK
ncbi:MAG: MlaD family protein [Bacteroidota bacterium]|nr:MlaD family protein [Candidatus Kapabacteria bacterium]MDW8220537.1 MlaD family protein [Bacteroidota bacterium]